jgi:hypothetical protein
VPEEPSTRREEPSAVDLRERLESIERRFVVGRFIWRLAMLIAFYLIAFDLFLIAIAIFLLGHHQRRYIMVAPMGSYSEAPYEAPPPRWGWPSPWTREPLQAPRGMMGPLGMMQRPMPPMPPMPPLPSPSPSVAAAPGPKP